MIEFSIFFGVGTAKWVNECVNGWSERSENQLSEPYDCELAITHSNSIIIVSLSCYLHEYVGD